MKVWNKETIKEQLQLHKKQNKDARYNYMCKEFNCLWYCWELEKYILECDEKIDKTTNYYLKTLAKNKSMPDEAVKMYNLLEDNIK